MLYKAALDLRNAGGKPDLRFYSCVRFVADSCSPAVFYVSKNWSTQQVQKAYLDGYVSGLTGLPSREVERLKERVLQTHKAAEEVKRPVLVYLKAGSWDQPADPETGHREGLVIPKREFVLSASTAVHQAHLYDYGLNAQTAILCLAAVGLDVMLPNVSFDMFADEEIETLKADYASERHQYLEVMAALASQSYDGLKAGDYGDVLRWAESEVAFKLTPKARVIEEAISSRSKRQLRRAGYSFWSDGMPAIGAAFMTSGIGGAGVMAGKEALKALVSAIAASADERAIPEVAYAMRISSAARGIAETD
ncbi:hypothetical protein [Nioella sp.]|uniref:hypothetical protein n=1 Tax=Nioella sp. TaxID=1912091 RepID=UPI003A88F25A